MTNRIVIIGSINVDNILHINRLPQPGETIAMSEYSQAAGGKGANQAVASARSGAATTFIGRVGDDNNGWLMIEKLKREGIDVRHVITSHTLPTGQAYILLQESGQNSIIIDHGANYQVMVEDVTAAADAIQAADFVITECETPIPAAAAAFHQAKAAGVRTILNPAPANQRLTPELLAHTDIIVPNETESGTLTGMPITDQASLAANAAYFRERGVATVLITLGDQGFYVVTDTGSRLLPAFPVHAVDTTGAGDAFIGALASELRPDLSNLYAAVQYAQRASSLAVQGLGAFPSIPHRLAVLAAAKNA